MTRIVYVGARKLRIPSAWDVWSFNRYRYRLRSPLVEVFLNGAWRPSVWLTTPAPKGRRVA